MIVMQLAMIGDGADDNPYRVDLPCYSMVSCDYDTMLAIVQVPDFLAPATAPIVQTPSGPKFDETVVIYGQSKAELQAWYSRIDKLYPKQDVPYQPTHDAKQP